MKSVPHGLWICDSHSDEPSVPLPQWSFCEGRMWCAVVLLNPNCNVKICPSESWDQICFGRPQNPKMPCAETWKNWVSCTPSCGMRLMDKEAYWTKRPIAILKQHANPLSNNEQPQVVCFTALHGCAAVKVTNANLPLWSANKTLAAWALRILRHTPC